MGFSDKLKDLGDKAKTAAAEHKDQINQAVETAGTVADRRTGGKYRDKIYKATQKAEAAVDQFAGDTQPGEPAATPGTPAAPSEPAAPSPPTTGETKGEAAPNEPAATEFPKLT